MEKINTLPSRLQRATDTAIIRHSVLITGMPVRLRGAFETIKMACRRKIDLHEQFIKMVAPEYILKRGYTLTYKQGKIVKTAGELSANDEITVKFADGEKKGIIK
jgi:exodeoxyribonuclease VII large subunit